MLTREEKEELEWYQSASDEDLMDMTDKDLEVKVEGNLLTIASPVPETPLYVVGSVHLERYLQNISSLGLVGA